MKTAEKKKTKNAKKIVVQVTRIRVACPTCGYPGATVNDVRGIVHCNKCHSTGAWPHPLPPPEKIARLLEAGFENVVSSEPTAFVILDESGQLVRVQVERCYAEVA